MISKRVLLAAALVSVASAAIGVSGCTLQARPPEPGTSHRAVRHDVALAVDGGPSSLATDGRRLFVGCFHGYGIQVFDLDTLAELHKVRLASYGRSETTDEVYYCPPGDMVVSGKRLFVEETFSDSIVVFDTESMEVLTRVKTGTQGAMTISPDLKTVYYADRLKNILFLIDAATYEVRQVSFPAGLSGIGAMAVSADGRYVYLGVQRSQAPGEAKPGADEAGGRAAWKSSTPRAAAIAVYDTRLRRYAATIRLVDLDRIDPEGRLQPADDGWPTGMALSPDGSRLYVTAISSDVAVYVIDVHANKLEQILRFKGPESSKSSPDAHSPLVYKDQLLVSLRNYRQLKIVDLAAPRRIHTAENWPDSNMSGLTPVLRVGHQLFYGDIEHKRVYLKDLRKDQWWLPTRPGGGDR